MGKKNISNRLNIIYRANSFLLKDLMEETIEGKFYYKELQKVYKKEKIIKNS